MKNFFNIKRIIYLSIICITLLTLILMLIFPIGVYPHSPVTIYSFYNHKLVKVPSSSHSIETTSPFTTPPFFNQGEDGKVIPDSILFAQTIVFSIVAIVFVVFTTFFVIELKRAGVFTRHPTKVELMQTQIDELQKQVEELKNDK